MQLRDDRESAIRSGLYSTKLHCNGIDRIARVIIKTEL